MENEAYLKSGKSCSNSSQRRINACTYDAVLSGAQVTHRQLAKISRDLFWKKSNEHKGLPMISWDKICQPKKVGGLGLRKMGVINRTFLSKLTWKLFND